ncbi:DUF2264 domain-containing protein [Enterovibrio norvegicus]|uniref:DUF2264 domain-containing protein n=1 Tax=Enterovibrio norvegicus TaxID=188144 RepID=UPI0024B244DF|nr:DUF2264 domain-containing protein [Enterovibrio norvegicus]
MKSFAMYGSNVEYTNRRDTVAVLTAFISDQMAAFCPENASLTSAPTHAHYDDKAQNLEGIARLLWGAIPLGDEASDVIEALRFAVVNGVNPDHSAFWGEVSDFNQRCVEMSAIAFAMVDEETRFYRAMNETERANLVRWLQAATYIRIPNNNWHFFRVLILMALRHVGAHFDMGVLRSDLHELDNMYLGDGWYRDGQGGCTDYYNPFAFHYYGLLFSRWTNVVSDSHTSELNAFSHHFIQRAALFAKSFSLWIGSNGAPITYGRSMSYRFAGAGVWSELANYSAALADVGLCVEDMKALWSVSLRWWSQQPILSDEMLSVGFRYPNLIASEFYNSPMSPLLALKGFAAVRLPESHPFWLATESDIHKQNTHIYLPAIKHIVVRQNGVSTLLTGSPSAAELRNSHDKYLKFAYSSAHGFCVESLRWIEQGFIGDNVFAFCHPNTRVWHFRTSLQKSELLEDRLLTEWTPFAGCVVQTTQWFVEGVEWRRHSISSEVEADFIMSGHAVDAWVKCIGGRECLEHALVEGRERTSQVLLVEGLGQYDVMPCPPNSNLNFSQAAVPVIHGTIPRGKSEWLINVISEQNK